MGTAGHWLTVPEVSALPDDGLPDPYLRVGRHVCWSWLQGTPVSHQDWLAQHGTCPAGCLLAPTVAPTRDRPSETVLPHTDPAVQQAIREAVQRAAQRETEHTCPASGWCPECRTMRVVVDAVGKPLDHTGLVAQPDPYEFSL